MSIFLDELTKNLHIRVGKGKIGAKCYCSRCCGGNLEQQHCSTLQLVRNMLIKTRGIIFQTIKYSETSIIADVYTEEKGFRKYIISGGRKKNARVSASLLQVMSIVDLVVYERPNRDLTRIKEIKPAYIFQSTPFEIKKGAVGLFMIEVARKTIREVEENRRLFQHLYNTLVFLDQTDKPVANLHLHFLLRLSIFLGFLPGGDFTERTPFFDLREGVFVSDVSDHTHYLDEQLSQVMYDLLQMEMEQCHQLKLSQQGRRILLNHLLDYYRLHLEYFPKINAHQILQEVLDGQ